MHDNLLKKLQKLTKIKYLADSKYSLGDGVRVQIKPIFHYRESCNFSVFLLSTTNYSLQQDSKIYDSVRLLRALLY